MAFIRISPALETPPPITKASGSTTAATFARAYPSLLPCWLQVIAFESSLPVKT